MSRAEIAGLGFLTALLISGPSAAPGNPPMFSPSVASGVAPRTELAASKPFGQSDVWAFLERINPGLAPRDVERISAAVIRYSEKYDLDPVLVTQLVWVESGARPWVRSPLGAIGLMQVMPHMAEPMGLAGNLASIESNTEAGCWILADNIRRLGEEDGISAYFWGSDIRSVAYLDRVREARAAVRPPAEY